MYFCRNHDRNSYFVFIYTSFILQLCRPTCLSIFFMPSSSSSSSSSVSSPSAPSFPVDRHLHVFSFYKHTVITQGSNWLGSYFVKSRSRHKELEPLHTVYNCKWYLVHVQCTCQVSRDTLILSL